MLNGLDYGINLTDKEGVATERFRAFLQKLVTEVNERIPLESTGSPESVVSGKVGQLCIDTAAAAGTGIYYKETGTGDTGWILRS